MASMLSWALLCTVATASATTSARTWRPSTAGFAFPEDEWSEVLAQHLGGKDFGVALAGGGTRGLALGHGILRSLRETGLLGKAKYLSVTSGSVWLGIPFYYQSLDSLDDYLGSTLQPTQMLPEEVVKKTGTAVSRITYLSEYPKGYQAGDSNKTVGTLLGSEANSTSKTVESGSIFGCPEDEGWCACMVSRFQPGSGHQLWSLFVAYIFLHPFDLAGRDSTHCHESQLERMRAKFGNSKTIYTAKDVSRKLPFLLPQSAILAPYTGLQADDPLKFFPLEQTPLYTGTVPAYPKNQSGMPHDIGDVLVESFAWDSKMVSPWNATNEDLMLDLSRGFFNAGDLAEWGGIATSYVADFQIREWADKIPRCLIAEGEKLLPQAKLWSPMEVDEKSVPVTYEQAVGDAGVYDDLGHIPLLRRRISKMAIITSEAIHLDLCEMTYVLAAFGQPGCLTPPNAAGASNPKMKAGSLTVFEPSEFPAFWSQVQSAVKANESAVIRGRYSVVDNEVLGIKGGWKADIVWVIILPSKTFRESIPPQTSKLLPTYFPNDLASEMKTRFEMSVASQYASWLMQRSVAKEISEMLGDVKEVII